MKDNARTIKYDSITSYAKEYGVEYLSNENLIASIIGIDPMLQGNEPIRKIFMVVIPSERQAREHCRSLHLSKE